MKLDSSDCDFCLPPPPKFNLRPPPAPWNIPVKCHSINYVNKHINLLIICMGVACTIISLVLIAVLVIYYRSDRNRLTRRRIKMRTCPPNRALMRYTNHCACCSARLSSSTAGYKSTNMEMNNQFIARRHNDTTQKLISSI
ncbi:hypothetical protein GJ496_000246 [Pomphorhynchus laevis]|nr:hypothetical protein GJ496_000246 [Pomphorhynchus laevis]